MARGLSVETTAEGVENEREAAVMRALGCDQLQGYLFGRPVPADELGEPQDAVTAAGPPFLAPRGRYKPPLGARIPRDYRLLGRRQVVRHRFLVPAFAGSNPAAPASLRLLRKLRLGKPAVRLSAR